MLGAAQQEAISIFRNEVTIVGSGAWEVDAAQTLAQRRLGDPRAPLHDEIAQYRTLYERYDRVSAIMREQIGPLR